MRFSFIDRDDVEIPFPVSMWDMEHCDPKKCSGRKLAKFRLINTLKLGQKFNGIVLTPIGEQVRLLSRMLIEEIIYIEQNTFSLVLYLYWF